jgi:hypothetical protein
LCTKFALKLMSDGSNSYRIKKKKEEVTLTKKNVKEGKAEAKLAVGIWLDSDFGIKRQRTDESAEEEDKINEDISCLHIR